MGSQAVSLHKAPLGEFAVANSVECARDNAPDQPDPDMEATITAWWDVCLPNTPASLQRSGGSGLLFG